ncbi:MAG: SseB family protein [Pikeienuella sp.]
MTDMQTPLDKAWVAATEAGDAEMARFYDLFAATELFLLIDPASLEGEATPQPQLFPVDGVDTALVFDTEERLAAFTGDGGAHLNLSGRAAIGMFAGSGAQLGVNLGDAPSATILPPQALDWAASALRQPIEATETGIALGAPAGANPALLTALDAKLAGMGAAVAEAWLCGADERLLLCVALRAAGAEQSVVSALAETARFAGGEQAAFDITVMPANDPRLAAARAVGFGYQPADPSAAMRQAPAAPGMDKDKPPILR